MKKMKWSWKMGKFAGIEIRLHITFLVLLVWVIGNDWMLGKGVEALLAELGFLLGLFSCVLLHEVGHALAARKYGIATKDITLLPVGGLGRIDK
jgi:Zn-dependent protease